VQPLLPLGRLQLHRVEGTREQPQQQLLPSQLLKEMEQLPMATTLQQPVMMQKPQQLQEIPPMQSSPSWHKLVTLLQACMGLTVTWLALWPQSMMRLRPVSRRTSQSSSLLQATSKVQQLKKKLAKTQERIDTAQESVARAIAKLHEEQDNQSAQQERLREAEEEVAKLALLAQPAAATGGGDVPDAKSNEYIDPKVAWQHLIGVELGPNLSSSEQALVHEFPAAADKLRAA
jgi:hypothetical protein